MTIFLILYLKEKQPHFYLHSHLEIEFLVDYFPLFFLINKVRSYTYITGKKYNTNEYM